MFVGSFAEKKSIKSGMKASIAFHYLWYLGVWCILQVSCVQSENSEPSDKLIFAHIVSKMISFSSTYYMPLTLNEMFIHSYSDMLIGICIRATQMIPGKVKFIGLKDWAH